jgi:hypothetical protein
MSSPVLTSFVSLRAKETTYIVGIKQKETLNKASTGQNVRTESVLGAQCRNVSTVGRVLTARALV